MWARWGDGCGAGSRVAEEKAGQRGGDQGPCGRLGNGADTGEPIDVDLSAEHVDAEIRGLGEVHGFAVGIECPG